MPHALDRDGYLAGRDAARLSDLTAAWADKTIGGIICARGGYGSMRIVDDLDYDVIADNPKIFVGFSDITSLLIAITQRVGLVTFHGPPLAWAPERLQQPATGESLRQALMSPSPLGVLSQPEGAPPVSAITSGRAAGPLIGGNLSMLCASIGTVDELDMKGAIVFFEDTEEPAYRVDRMLTQLLRTGKLQTAAGLVAGEFVEAPSPTKGSAKASMSEVISDRLARLGLPTVSGFAIGHGLHQLTLPLGIEATLDADSKELILNESATIPPGDPSEPLS